MGLFLGQRAQDRVKLTSPRSGYFDERTKNMNEKKIEKNEMYFWQKNERVILDDGPFDGPKSSLRPCSFS